MANLNNRQITQTFRPLLVLTPFPAFLIGFPTKGGGVYNPKIPRQAPSTKIFQIVIGPRPDIPVIRGISMLVLLFFAFNRVFHTPMSLFGVGRFR